LHEEQVALFAHARAQLLFAVEFSVLCLIIRMTAYLTIYLLDRATKLSRDSPRPVDATAETISRYTKYTGQKRVSVRGLHESLPRCALRIERRRGLRPELTYSAAPLTAGIAAISPWCCGQLFDRDSGRATGRGIA